MNRNIADRGNPYTGGGHTYNQLLKQRKMAYSVPEASDTTGIPVSTLWRLIKEGRLKSAKVGRRRLILADALMTFLEDQAA